MNTDDMLYLLRIIGAGFIFGMFFMMTIKILDGDQHRLGTIKTDTINEVL